MNKAAIGLFSILILLNIFIYAVIAVSEYDGYDDMDDNFESAEYIEEQTREIIFNPKRRRERRRKHQGINHFIVILILGGR